MSCIPSKAGLLRVKHIQSKCHSNCFFRLFCCSIQGKAKIDMVLFCHLISCNLFNPNINICSGLMSWQHLLTGPNKTHLLMVQTQVILPIHSTSGWLFYTREALLLTTTCHLLQANKSIQSHHPFFGFLFSFF